MAFNVKTRRAKALWESLLTKTEGQRHGITGFWVASLDRVRKETRVRVAYLPEARFVFEATIDPDETHVMTASRMDEYIEHELLKRAYEGPQDPDEITRTLRDCLAQGRVVVAFRDARPYDAYTNHNDQNPIWYTTD